MKDTRRDAAYTIFYMGVNVGAALGTILVGYLGETIGWAYGFGLAGIGMVLGMIIFVLGRPALRGRGEAPHGLTSSREMTLYGIGIAGVAVIWGLIQFQDVIQNLLVISGVAMLAFVLFQAVFVFPYGRVSQAPQGNVIAMSVGLFLLVVAMLGQSMGFLSSSIGLAGIAIGFLIALYVCVAE